MPHSMTPRLAAPHSAGTPPRRVRISGLAVAPIPTSSKETHVPHRLQYAVHWLARGLDSVGPFYGWAISVAVAFLASPASEMLAAPLSLLFGLSIWHLVLRSFGPESLRADGDGAMAKATGILMVLAFHVIGYWGTTYDVPGLPAWLGIALCGVLVARQLREIDRYVHIPGVSGVIAVLETWSARVLPPEPEGRGRARRAR